MYKKILIPIEGTERDEAILPYAENLAVHYNAGLVLLHVEDPPILLERDEVLDMERYWEARISHQKETREHFGRIVQQWLDKDIKAELRIKMGIGQCSIVRSILDAAKSEHADLVAMASHGRKGLTRAICGSIAAGVFQQIDRPLLLIRS